LPNGACFPRGTRRFRFPRFHLANNPLFPGFIRRWPLDAFRNNRFHQKAASRRSHVQTMEATE
jgi:hypothetical protein